MTKTVQFILLLSAGPIIVKLLEYFGIDLGWELMGIFLIFYIFVVQTNQNKATYELNQRIDELDSKLDEFEDLESRIYNLEDFVRKIPTTL